MKHPDCTSGAECDPRWPAPENGAASHRVCALLDEINDAAPPPPYPFTPAPGVTVRPN